jgi:hypothetical protein
LQRTTAGIQVILTREELEHFDGHTSDFAQWITNHLSPA